eukprot:TRINITY_DN6793_c0_g2_i1.p1 TRINITY_DN6793_c0_g2~~TRINITY_DN6793_c0_g2_i1.p1  ORF type:complete len:416 (-),score=30.80 TRINITY_DN6793_c0_g2_i1:435-1682(-)
MGEIPSGTCMQSPPQVKTSMTVIRTVLAIGLAVLGLPGCSAELVGSFRILSCAAAVSALMTLRTTFNLWIHFHLLSTSCMAVWVGFAWPLELVVLFVLNVIWALFHIAYSSLAQIGFLAKCGYGALACTSLPFGMAVRKLVEGLLEQVCLTSSSPDAWDTVCVYRAFPTVMYVALILTFLFDLNSESAGNDDVARFYMSQDAHGANKHAYSNDVSASSCSSAADWPACPSFVSEDILHRQLSRTSLRQRPSSVAEDILHRQLSWTSLRQLPSSVAEDLVNRQLSWTSLRQPSMDNSGDVSASSCPPAADRPACASSVPEDILHRQLSWISLRQCPPSVAEDILHRQLSWTSLRQPSTDTCSLSSSQQSSEPMTRQLSSGSDGDSVLVLRRQTSGRSARSEGRRAMPTVDEDAVAD